MTTQSKRKQQGSQLRSRQRAQGMAVALGLALAITLGLLSVAGTSPTVLIQNRVSRNLRSDIGPISATQMEEWRGHGRLVPAIAMESAGVLRGNAALLPESKAHPPHEAPNGGGLEAKPIVMEATYQKTEDQEQPAANTVADAEAKAERAIQIAKEAEKAAKLAEEHAADAEAAAEMAIMMQVGGAAGALPADPNAAGQDPQANTPSFKQPKHAL